MRKLLLATVAVVALATSAKAEIAYCAIDAPIKLTGQQSPVRDLPINGKIIGWLSNGDQVNVIDEIIIKGHNWDFIKVENGNVLAPPAGWVPGAILHCI